MAEAKDGKNKIRNTDTFGWFQDWKTSHNMKTGVNFNSCNHNIPLAYPKVDRLTRLLHNYWLSRYNSQFPDDEDDNKTWADVAKKVTSM